MLRELRTCLVVAAIAGVVLLGLIALAAYAAFHAHWGPPFGSDGPQSSWCAMWAGDVDGDGAPDILLSTPFEHVVHGYGSVRVFSGKTRRCLRTISNVYHPNPAWSAMASAGDVDGDGHDDVFVERSGRKTVISVGDGRELLSLACDLSELFTPIGDVDGDGGADLLVGGYPRAAKPARFASVISGKTGQVVWSVEGSTIARELVPHSFAWNGCAAGDVDGDGIVDVAINTEFDRVRVLSGRNGAMLRDLAFEFVSLGGMLAPMAKLHRDGSSALLLRGDYDQVVQVVDPRSDVELFTVAFPADDHFIDALCSVGDQDGDDVPDIALGWDSLRMYSGVDGHALGEIDDVGFASGAADLDHDGRNDLLVTRNVYGDAAARLGDDVWRAGRVEVLSGRDRSVLLELDGDDLTPIAR